MKLRESRTVGAWLITWQNLWWWIPFRWRTTSGSGGDKWERLKVWGEHMTGWRCVWTWMGFCAADNSNASNSYNVGKFFNFLGFCRFLNFIQLTFSTFPPPLLISYSHLFISCQLSPYSFLGNTGYLVWRTTGYNHTNLLDVHHVLRYWIMSLSEHSLGQNLFGITAHHFLA